MKILFFICLYLCLHAGIDAQQPASTAIHQEAITERSLTVEDGLPQGFINGIVQDAQGFMWMGTRDGLTRYDGRNVKVFRNDASDTASISSNVFNTIYIDRKNKIWIIHENYDVDVLDPVSEKVRHISKEPAFKWMQQTHIGRPYAFIQDRNNTYWIISDVGKLAHFSLENPVPVFTLLNKNEQAFSMKEEHDLLWISTNKALYTYHGNTLKLVSLLPKPFQIHGWETNYNSAMVRDGHNDWIIGGPGNIQVYNQKQNKWLIIPTLLRLNSFLSVSANGSVYLNADTWLYRLDADHSLIPVWKNNNTPGNFVSMAIDRSDVLWVGMNTFGAKMINLASHGFHSYPYQMGFFNDVLHQGLHIPVDISNRNKSERWRMDSNNWLDNYRAKSAIDKKGNLWGINLPSDNIGGREYRYGDSVFIFNLRKGDANLTAIYLDTAKGFELVQSLTFDNKNRCWTTLYSRNLARVDLSAKTIRPVLELTYSDGLAVYLAAFQDKVCIVFKDAIQIYDPQTHKSSIHKGAGIFNNANLLMAEADPQVSGVLWIASMGNGLIRFDARTGHAKAFTGKDGIPSNTVYAIIPDKHGFLWCSSNMGIFRFNPKDNSLISFTSKDGLQGNEFNRYHYLATPEGQMFFGGTEGWTMFHPDSIRIDNHQPQSVITEVLVNNSPLNAQTGFKDSAVSSIQTLRLPYDKNFLTFYVAGLQYNEPDKLQYRYKLEGVDKDWVQIGNRNIANYTNLPPGNYLFKVNATNTAGLWSDHIKTMRIIISPPWWRTWWAYSLYVAAALAFVIVYFRIRMKQVRIKQAMLFQQKETEHLRAVDEMKTRFFSNITHEFRTPLSLIIAPLEDLKRNPEIPGTARKILSGVQRNAQQLARLINQLLDLSKLEAGNMRTHRSRGELNIFVEECVKSFQLLAEAKQIDLRYQSANADGEYEFDSEKCEKIIFNLLSNAIKFTPESGTVHVKLAIEQSTGYRCNMLLHVSDTGIGIPQEKLGKIFTRFFQVDDSRTRKYEGTGIGLALAQELTELMGGTIQVHSVPGEGTTFHLSIPVQKASDQIIPLWQSLNLPPELPAAEPAHRVLHTSSADGHTPLILVVEDNVELSAFIASALASHYRVLTAPDGEAGLKITQEELPDIIISDIMMPKMDGYELCKHIKQGEKTNHITFIILSAKTSHDSVIEGFRSYADEYITKPFYVDELLLRIHNILHHQEKLRAHHHRQLTNPNESIDPAREPNQLLKQLYKVIDDHIDDSSLSVEKLAGKIAVSHRTLNRKLSALVGLSANEVIRQYRLKKAAELLKTGQHVSEVAYKVGFDTPSYFTVSFKAFYGVTPSEYAAG
jgi:signal transduction histidine kinase/ligand-binding sensor domain-containing protein/AraC-like DNA-binding protein